MERNCKLSKHSFKSYEKSGKQLYSIENLISKNHYTLLHALLPFNKEKWVPINTPTLLLGETSYVVAQKDLNKKKQLLHNTVSTDSAYIIELSNSRMFYFELPKRLYYYNRNQDTLELIVKLDEGEDNSFFACFPSRNGLTTDNVVVKTVKSKFNLLYDFLEENNKTFLSSLPSITNLTEEPLLYYAARMGNQYAIKELSDQKENQNIIVRYRAIPGNEIFEFNFEQLSAFIENRISSNLSFSPSTQVQQPTT